MSDDPVMLASTCRLPQAVERNDAHNTASQEKVLRSSHIQQALSHTAVAPYQALPVAGPVLTSSGVGKSPSLPVLDQAEMTEEVRAPNVSANTWWSPA